METGSPRTCTWLSEPHGKVVTMTPAAWWLALTRNARTVRYRTDRHRRVGPTCRMNDHRQWNRHQ